MVKYLSLLYRQSTSLDKAWLASSLDKACLEKAAGDVTSMLIMMQFTKEPKPEILWDWILHTVIPA